MVLTAVAVVGAGLGACLPAMRSDTYQSYGELSRHEREGVDYQITVVDRAAPVTVLAIHGGPIDFGTHLIAQALAGSDWSLYVFQGLKQRGNWSLHITSANFDEPRALALAARSLRCVSIHGHQSEVPRICVGGADENLRSKVAASLSGSGLPFRIETLCPGFEGTAPTNVVNQCRAGGVQLEFSSRLRETMASDRALFDRTIAAIRQAVDPPG